MNIRELNLQFFPHLKGRGKLSDRQEYITDQITIKKFLSVDELSSALGVSGETIRRDLKALEKQGVLMRTYGGAYLVGSRESDVSVHVRKSIMMENKRLIAEQCVSLIHPDDTIFLDSSTTSLEIAKCITQMPVTVITNSALIVSYLSPFTNIRTVCLGGVLDPNNMCFLGKLALQNMEQLYARKAFVSCRSISETYGAMDSNEQICQVRTAAIKSSDKCYLIADYTKLGNSSLYKIGGFHDFDMLVMDQKPPPEWLEIFSERGMEVHYPGGVSYPAVPEE